jgi:hypothetical protein
MPRDPFGTAVVTNVGSFGIDTAFAPFIPAGRTSMLLLLTEVKPRPMVVDGRVEARPVLRLCATFDHRIVDGSAAGVVAKELRELVERPARARRRAVALAQLSRPPPRKCQELDHDRIRLLHRARRKLPSMGSKASPGSRDFRATPPGTAGTSTSATSTGSQAATPCS